MAGAHAVYRNVTPLAKDINLYYSATSTSAPLTSGGNNDGRAMDGNWIVGSGVRYGNQFR